MDASVEALWYLLCEDAEADEIRFGERFATEHGLDQLCLVLLNTNEFLYVD